MEFLFCRYTLLGYINFILNDKILMVSVMFFFFLSRAVLLLYCYHFVRHLQLLHTNAQQIYNVLIRVYWDYNKMPLIMS